MKYSRKTFICLLSSFALAAGAKAVTSDLGSFRHGENIRSTASANNVGDTSYETIVRRNVFDLKEPQLTYDTNVPTQPSPNVKLTGIMTILGQKQALFMVQKPVTPGKALEPSESCILSEGQRQGGLEVLAIDQKGAKVTVKNDGVVSTITFDAPKPVASSSMNPPTAHMGRPGFRSNLNPDAATPPPLPIP